MLKKIWEISCYEGRKITSEASEA